MKFLIVTKIYGMNGGIATDSKEAVMMNIYNIAGSLVKKAQVGEGNTWISLRKGIYVVVFGNLSYKVLVK